MRVINLNFLSGRIFDETRNVSGVHNVLPKSTACVLPKYESHKILFCHIRHQEILRLRYEHDRKYISKIDG